MGGESSGEAGGSAIRVRGIAVVPGRVSAWPGTHASHKQHGGPPWKYGRFSASWEGDGSVSLEPREMDIQAMVFDIGNVLLDFDFAPLLAEVSRRTGRPPADIASWFATTELESAFEKGRLDPQTFHQRVMEALGLSLPFEAFVCLWNDIFTETPAMEPLVRTLGTRYPLFAASNTNPLHLEHVRKRFPLLETFRDVIASCEVGSRKPEPGIYREILRRTGTGPARLLFIDDIQRNIDGASRAGMLGLLFRGADDLRRRLQALGVVLD